MERETTENKDMTTESPERRCLTCDGKLTVLKEFKNSCLCGTCYLRMVCDRMQTLPLEEAAKLWEKYIQESRED